MKARNKTRTKMMTPQTKTPLNPMMTKLATGVHPLLALPALPRTRKESKSAQHTLTRATRPPLRPLAPRHPSRSINPPRRTRLSQHKSGRLQQRTTTITPSARMPRPHRPQAPAGPPLLSPIIFPSVRVRECTEVPHGVVRLRLRTPRVLEHPRLPHRTRPTHRRIRTRTRMAVRQVGYTVLARQLGVRRALVSRGSVFPRERRLLMRGLDSRRRRIIRVGVGR